MDTKDSLVQFYDHFLNHFSKRVRASTVGKKTKIIRLKEDFRGLANLFESFTTGSLAEGNDVGTVREWNPFSQRPYYTMSKRDKPVDLTKDLTESTDVIRNFIEFAHESSHVLLLERFFVGKQKSWNRHDFKEFMYASEGYCFWFADIVVTRKLRVKLADGEFVFGRSSVSQKFIHPYRVFESLKIRDEKKILDIYLRAFVGERTKLYKFSGKLLVEELFKRFVGIYFSNLNAVDGLYERLDKIEIFSQFQKRFCIQGLPSLLPNNILCITDLRKYIRAVYEYGMPYIHSLSQKKIEQIKIRRHIQTRAYMAYCVMYATKNNLFFSRKKPAIDKEYLLNYLKIYLDSLEQNLRDVADGSSFKEILSNCRKTDRFYSNFILKYFVTSDIWMSSRYLVSPFFMKAKFGLLNSKSQMSRLDKRKFEKRILDYSYNKLLTENLYKTPNIIRDIGNFIGSISEKKLSPTWRKSVNKLLTDPKFFDLWSIPLNSINPEKNRFREILFVYE